jgi:hypothetical protein
VNSTLHMTSAQIPIADESVTAYGWKALAGSVIGFSMDGFDMLILGFMLAPISADLGLTSAQAGSLVTWTMLGAVAGGLLFGYLSDRLGRIQVLTWTILIFAVFTGLCALARDYRDLVFFRAIAGLGLGGEFGIGMALATEAWPAHKRARASSYVMVGWHGGVLLAAFTTPALLPVIGWRGMFLVGIVPAVVAFAVRRALDEPEIFLQKHADKTENSFRALVKDGKTFRTTLGIAILCAVQNFAYYGLMVWLPSYLTKTLGFSLTKSGFVDGCDGPGYGVRYMGVWATRRPYRTEAQFPHVPDWCADYDFPVFADDRSEHASLGGSDHGCVCEWLEWRDWRAYIGGVSHLGPRDCAEYALEPWSRSWFAWATHCRCAGDEIFLSRSDRASCFDLYPRHHRHSVPDPGTQR